MAGVRVDVVKSTLKNAEDAIESQIFDRWDECGPDIGEIFVEVCTPFVPLKDGGLINSGHVINSGKEGIYVGWDATNKGYDYARKQYYHSFYHPLQGIDHWDQYAMAQEGDTFIARVERELKG